MEIDLHVHGLVDRDLQEFVLETELPPSSAKTIWSVGKGTSAPSPKTTDVPGGPFCRIGSFDTTSGSRVMRVPETNSMSSGYAFTLVILRRPPSTNAVAAGTEVRCSSSVSDVCDVPERLYIAAADGTADRID